LFDSNNGFLLDSKSIIKKTRAIGRCKKYRMYVTLPISRVHKCINRNNTWICPNLIVNINTSFWKGKHCKLSKYNKMEE